jgi:hypothetical protein
MSPPPRPTSLDYFFAQYQYPILAGALGLHFAHHQYIRRTQPVVELSGDFARTSSFPRPLRAGLVWAVVLAGILTKTTLAQKIVGNYSDPIIARSSSRRQLMSRPEEGI